MAAHAHDMFCPLTYSEDHSQYLKNQLSKIFAQQDANSSDVQSGKMRDSADLLFTACSRTTHPSNDTCKINSKVTFALGANTAVNTLLIDFNFIMIDLAKYYMHYVMV